MWTKLNDIQRLIQTGKYLDIINRHGFFDDPTKTIDDFIRVLDTLPIIIERINGYDGDAAKAISEEVFDSLRFVANMISFTDSMLPLANKYNPDDETKQKLIDYILKMEENDEDT